MGTKANPGEYDCYGKAEDDEPMFTLLARDPQAPDLIRQWAVHRQYTDPKKAREALACAVDMEQWHKENRDASDT